ncbi:MAG: hypothetical protein ACI9VS_004027 [Candidatus Binatia bacterium]|jgi:hypothetical protein
MAKKGEISWKGRNEDGDRREVYAKHKGNRWSFFVREKRNDQWKTLEDPPLDDWLELLDGVQRRIQRQLVRPEEEERVKKTIRKRHPNADI